MFSTDRLAYKHTLEYVKSRPRLRGWSHLIMAPIAAFLAVWIVVAATGVGKITASIFGVTLVGLYTVSSTYHIGKWTGKARMLLGRADTAMIVVFIAGSFTPIAVHALDGPWRLYSLIGAWAIALIGVGMAVSPLMAPRWFRTAGYIAMGWMVGVPSFQIAQALPVPAMTLIVAGGVLYSVGGVVYATRKPDPAPEWFGFHEIFHLFVVVASVLHYVAILNYIVT